MNDLLFDVPETPSSRLKWIREHGVRLHETPEGIAGQEDEISGELIAKFYAYVGKLGFNDRNSAGGETENDALVALAIKKRWKHWNL